MYPDFLHGDPPTAAYAAFIKQSRMKVVNASKLDRNSGVRFGEAWSTRPISSGLCYTDFFGDSFSRWWFMENLTGFQLPCCEERDLLCPRPHHENSSSGDHAG
jgi:hypothetical protein